MSYTKDTKKAIEIYEMVAIPLREEYGDKIKIALGDMDLIKDREGHYIQAGKIPCISGNIISIDSFDNRGVKKFKKDVREMMNNALWTRVDKICIDMIGATLYINKEEEVVVEAINKDGVLLDNGDTVDANTLFKKD